MTATAQLLAFASAQHRLPEAVRADTLRLLADTLAVGAAGAGAPGADAILAAARAMGAANDARLIGCDERLPAPGAAFVNGYRIHCLEWDAVHEPAVVHAMSTVTAALAQQSTGGPGHMAAATTKRRWSHWRLAWISPAASACRQIARWHFSALPLRV